MADWLIRRALPTDLEAILAIEQASPAAPHWSRSQWLEALTGEPAKGPVRASFVAEDSGCIVGFAVVSCAGVLAELESVVVSKPARRQGVGKALCLQVVHWSRKAGASELELEVRASSDGALSLYHSLGFVEQGRRKEYYRNPTEDAVLMVARLHS